MSPIPCRGSSSNSSTFFQPTSRYCRPHSASSVLTPLADASWQSQELPPRCRSCSSQEDSVPPAPSPHPVQPPTSPSPADGSATRETEDVGGKTDSWRHGAIPAWVSQNLSSQAQQLSKMHEYIACVAVYFAASGGRLVEPCPTPADRGVRDSPQVRHRGTFLGTAGNWKELSSWPANAKGPEHVQAITQCVTNQPTCPSKLACSWAPWAPCS